MLLLTEASVHVACLQAGKAGRAWDRSGLGDKTTGWGWLKVKKKRVKKMALALQYLISVVYFRPITFLPKLQSVSSNERFTGVYETFILLLSMLE